MNGFVVWFTGLSGAGKSTLATLLAGALAARGVHVEVLDGDEVRTYLSKGLGFSREDRDTNVRRVGFVAKLLARAGACAITAAISPYRAIRDEQRAAIGRFVEVYCKAPIEALADRDPKGLYKKALAGEIENFTGVSDPYEPPLEPEVVLDTAGHTAAESLAELLARLEELGYLEPKRGPKLTAAWGGKLALARSPSDARGHVVARIEIDDDGHRLAAAVAFGLLSPMRGPSSEKDATKLAKEGRLESGVRWPLAFSLPVSGARGRASRGDLVELVASAGAPDGGLLLEVEEAYEREGRTFIAGEILVEPPRPVLSIRRDLASEGFATAAGMLVRAPLDDGARLLANVGLEARDRIVFFVASPVATASVESFVRERGLASRARVVPIPSLPVLDPDRDPLLSVIVLRNLGAGAALIDAPHGPDAAAPRDVLGEMHDVEIGIDILAAGPTRVVDGGGSVTARMAPVLFETGRRP